MLPERQNSSRQFQGAAYLLCGTFSYIFADNNDLFFFVQCVRRLPRLRETIWQNRPRQPPAPSLSCACDFHHEPFSAISEKIDCLRVLGCLLQRLMNCCVRMSVLSPCPCRIHTHQAFFLCFAKQNNPERTRRVYAKNSARILFASSMLLYTLTLILGFPPIIADSERSGVSRYKHKIRLPIVSARPISYPTPKLG